MTHGGRLAGRYRASVVGDDVDGVARNGKSRHPRRMTACARIVLGADVVPVGHQACGELDWRAANGNHQIFSEALVCVSVGVDEADLLV